MKTREETIAFEMNYCQHYGRGKGADMVCAAGVDLKTMQKVATGEKAIKWGPCIEGHTLTNPHDHCPHWIRRTREQGEKRADGVEKSISATTEMKAGILTGANREHGEKVSAASALSCSIRSLTPAQRLVLRGIALGHKPNQIAAELPDGMRVSARGVRFHREQIYRKLGIHTIAEATRLAITAGLILKCGVGSAECGIPKIQHSALNTQHWPKSQLPPVCFPCDNSILTH